MELELPSVSEHYQEANFAFRQRKINKSRKMKGLPDLSVIVASQLGLAGSEPADSPSGARIADTNDIVPEQLVSSSATAVVTSSKKKRKSKKRSRDDAAIDEVREPIREETDAIDQSRGPEPPKKRKKKKKSSDQQSHVEGETDPREPKINDTADRVDLVAEPSLDPILADDSS